LLLDAKNKLYAFSQSKCNCLHVTYYSVTAACIDEKRSTKKILKTLKNVKKRDKNKKNVCKR